MHHEEEGLYRLLFFLLFSTRLRLPIRTRVRLVRARLRRVLETHTHTRVLARSFKFLKA